MDMADPGQARGSSFQVLDALAEELGDRLLAALHSPAAATTDRLHVHRLRCALPLRYGPLSERQARSKVREWKEGFAGFLGLPVSEVPEDFSINARIKERCIELGSSPEEVRRWVARQFAYTAFLALTGRGETEAGERSSGFSKHDGFMPVSAGILDFGPLTVLTVPAEVLVEAALDWQQKHPGRIALVAGLADGWLGYLPHEANFREPRASELYETVSTLFAPDAAGLLLEKAQQTLRQAGGRTAGARQPAGEPAPSSPDNGRRNRKRPQGRRRSR
jgi:hypothetical protein